MQFELVEDPLSEVRLLSMLFVGVAGFDEFGTGINLWSHLFQDLSLSFLPVPTDGGNFGSDGVDMPSSKWTLEDAEADTGSDLLAFAGKINDRRGLQNLQDKKEEL